MTDARYARPVPTPTADIVARLRSAGCVFAEDEARLLVSTARGPVELETLVCRRVAGEPLEHLLGWVTFLRRRIVLDPGVFVPRRRTEFLARRAAVLARRAAVLARRGVAARAGSAPAGPTGVDLCCGSGAVGAVLLAEVPGMVVHAVDIDPAAVACARRNISAPGSVVYQGDLYEALPAALRGRVDVLVANAPYVPSDAVGALPREARMHEPRAALDGGSDGLDVLRRVIVEAPSWLAPGGHLLVESSETQAPRLAEAAAAIGLRPDIARSDRLDATVVTGTRPAAG